MNDINIAKNWLQNNLGHDKFELQKDVFDVISKNLNSDLCDPDIDTYNIAFIIHKLSEMPWYTQKQLLEDLKIDKKELIKLNKIIYKNNLFQELITKYGLGRKYWNTMIPYKKNGVDKKVVNYEYQFPLRLALFPGLSCMYYCGFCGRNQKARYKGNVTKDGNQRFKDIISSMPKYSTLSISGGLEPLTNPGLGEIISHAKSKGVRVPLITNAHMLTPKYLEKTPGIWDLDSLRVSLYGTDDESTFFITRHKKAYNLVRNNIIEFLKLRNKINPNLKLGLNYIIIPENIDTILPLLDYIIDINSHVDNGRGIDFLTLREDFGSVTEITDDVDKIVEGRKYHLDGFLSDEQRVKLINIFNEFNVRKEKECSKMHVDFGYAMVALGEGVLGKPLIRVNGKQMRKSGYPQMSVAVDSLGDVFLYREAGFLDRPGNDKFKAGRITSGKSIEDVIREYVENKIEVDRDDVDCRFMDSYDHLMTLLVNQTESDMKLGISSPINIKYDNQKNQISNNWYKD
tara:strand:- start:643 stop:2184 length:1542 start_codon:yes stop_codon:yes gene_type:complete